MILSTQEFLRNPDYSFDGFVLSREQFEQVEDIILVNERKKSIAEKGALTHEQVLQHIRSK